MSFLQKNIPFLLSVSLHITIISFFLFYTPKQEITPETNEEFTELTLSEGIGGEEGGGDGFPLPPEKKVFVNTSTDAVKEKKKEVKVSDKKEPFVKQDDYTSGKEDGKNVERYGTGLGQGTGIGNKTGSGTGTGVPKEEKKETPPPVVESNVYVVGPEIRPEPIGGMQSIYARLNYTDEAKEKGIKGEVLIRAFIDENGVVRKTQLLKGLGYGLDQSAANAIKKTRFKPGKQKGINLKVQMDISIAF